MALTTNWRNYKNNNSSEIFFGLKKNKQCSKRKNTKKDENDESDSSESENPKDILNMLSKKSRSDSGPDNLYTIDNNIYFQDDITHDSISALNKELRLLALELSTMATTYDMEPPPIKLHITSYGGSVTAAFSAIDCIETSKVPVHTIIDGYAASAATMISVCGAKRYIKKHASMLIHQLSAGAWGKMAEIEDTYNNLQKAHEQIKQIYITKTKLKRKNLSKILEHDIDWDADECLANGLVDEII
jgi:ATP-dependent protease ClpP protease subunit